MTMSRWLRVLAFMLTCFSIVVGYQSTRATRADIDLKQTPSTPGELLIAGPEGKPAGACPLKGTDVDADISGFIARVTVTQEFQNPTNEKIEAVYTFPLPNDSAVDRMEMTVGTRVIVGEIHRREEARAIYEAAREAGQVASLLDQERPNIFTQSVANIMPGDKVKITISYTQILKYEAGVYEFTFPMVVGPRFIPGNATGREGTGWAPDTDTVPDASKITPPVTPKGTRAGHDISMQVKIEAGVPLQSVSSDLHEVTIEELSLSSAIVRLKNEREIPNKDFVLKYVVGSDQVQTGIITHARDEGNGFFTLIMQPPKSPTAAQITPKEMIFVIDTSGSQMGEPMAKSKEAMLHCIRNVNPGDTFNMISFSNDVKKLFERAQPFNKDTEAAALKYLEECDAGGGTYMLPAIKSALEPANDPNRLRIVVLFTDGYIGNDFELINEVRKNTAKSRVFTFGIGNSVNRFLIDKMAEAGRGTAEYVLLNSDGQRVAQKFYDRIRSPLLTDISIEWGGAPIVESDIYPKVLPDLFSSQPLVVKGRYSWRQNIDRKGCKIVIRGKLGGKPWEQTLDLILPREQRENDSLASIWARAKVDELMDRDLMGAQTGKPEEGIKEAIIDTALEYGLMTQYTSFVAVEPTIVTVGGKPRRIAVPVEMPEGVSYEGVFGAEAEAGPSPSSNFYFARAAKPVSKGRGYAGAARMSEPAADASRVAATMPAREELRRPVDGRVSGRKFDVVELADRDSDTYVRDAKPGETASQKLEREAMAKLDATLRDLLVKYASEGKSGKYAIPNKLEVSDGKVEVLVWVTGATSKTMAQLRALGLLNAEWVLKDKVLIGRVDIAKLQELARANQVVRIAPPIYLKK